MKSNPDTLTPTEAARLLMLSPATIRRLIDSGFLRGWRLPDSKFRRLRRVDVLTFAAAHGIPIREQTS